MSVPNPGSTRVHFSRGASSRDSAPVQRSATSFEQFCVQIHHDRVQTTGKAAKGLQYICAPVAVARAAGVWASRLDGSPIVYNNADPYLPDLLVCHPLLVERVREALDRFEG